MATYTPDSSVDGRRLEGEAASVSRLPGVVEAWPLQRSETIPSIDWQRIANVWTVVFLGLIEVLLSFRLGFRLADANTQNGFVKAVYDVTGVLVAPFKEIILDSKLGAGGVFEPSTLVAMLVYMVASVVVMSVVWAMVSTQDARHPQRGRLSSENPDNRRRPSARDLG